MTSSKGWSVTEIGEYVTNRSKRSQVGQSQDERERRPSRAAGPLTFHGYDINAVPSRRKDSDNSGHALTGDLESSIGSRPSAALDSPTDSNTMSTLGPLPTGTENLLSPTSEK